SDKVQFNYTVFNVFLDEMISSMDVLDNATYSAFADDIAVQSCFFDIQLTNLSPRNYIPPEVLFEYQYIRHGRHLKKLSVQS
ncbi:hypothetical protein Tco_0075545, partial [Tanacetum coccineum]